MIKSMTGYGRSENQQNDHKFTVEMKSVNHRYFDVNVKLPKKFSFFESSVRNCLKNYVQRGKIDIYISYDNYTESDFALKYNEGIAAEYVKYFRQMAENFDLEHDIRVSTLGRCPEVFTMEEQDIDEVMLWSILAKALIAASEQLVRNREAEGEHLAQDLVAKLSGMLADIAGIEERAPGILIDYRKKLEDKVKELLDDAQMEETRIAAEVVLYADKICTDEETVRLRSHIESMQATLQEDGSVGRKLDFIAQEMNREANTILSKANDLGTSKHAINLKTDIEKIREQIQNIE